MKKLLFLISLIAIALYSCNAALSRKKEKKNITNNITLDTIKKIGAVKDVSTTINKNKKDAVKKDPIPRAIIHNAPNQTVIDSVKKQKLLNKKR